MDMYVFHMDSYTQTVARKVGAAIEAGGQTQLGISDATGIPRTTLIRRLAGVSPFNLAELKSIALTLGITVGDLIDVTEDGAA